MPSDPEKPFNGQTIFLFNLLILTLISRCMIPRTDADKLITNYASKNTERITEAVKFVIGATEARKSEAMGKPNCLIRPLSLCYL
jgi:hypothetical protein